MVVRLIDGFETWMCRVSLNSKLEMGASRSGVRAQGRYEATV